MNFTIYIPILALLLFGYERIADAKLWQVELPLRQNVIDKADQWLNQFAISYAWGGSTLGNDEQCQACNRCLSERGVVPKQQLKTCPECQKCSLDCSHFVSLVYREAGLESPYLTTSMMRVLKPDDLRRQYSWLVVGDRAERALPGDLLVYDGHVTMVTHVKQSGVGDLIHVTSGSHIKGPGQAIQKQRNVTFDGFRGPVVRVLRHRALQKEWQEKVRQSKVVRRISPG